METLSKIVYTGTATATGGRNGKAESSDGKLSVNLSLPKEMGGPGGEGTNPEQMFAAGYAACFIGALGLVASRQDIKLPDDVKVTGETSIGPVGDGFGLAVVLTVESGDLELDTAQKLADQAHEVCPYSNATRGNIEVTIKVI